jgi:transcriptional regulator with XRE-family HTH domain
MKDREPTVRSRELGEGLREAMKYAGFNQQQLADELGWTQSRVSRLLSGKRGGSTSDVIAFCAVCHYHGAKRDRLLELALDRDRRGWHQQHGARLPKQLRTLMDHENKALRIDSFQAILMPGLLQTGDYARGIMASSANLPAEEVDERVSLRLSRRELLSRHNAPQFTYFVHESVLRTPVGGAIVMSDQLHSLLRDSVRPNVTVRVVPAALGAHAGVAGSFTILDVRDFKPVVYLDSETSCLFLEAPIEIDAYRNIVAVLRGTALDEGQSRELIGNLAVELYAE